MALFKKRSQAPQVDVQSLSRSESAAALPDSEDTKAPSPEIVAVIMAAVLSMMSVRNLGDLQIKSIRRIGRHSPVWNTAGRDEYITSKL